MVHPGPEFSVADVCTGWVRGLTSLGVDVQLYNLNERLSFYTNAYLKADDETYIKAFPTEAAMELAAQHLRSACYDWWPDLVVVISCFWIPPFVLEVMRARRHQLVCVYTESPYEDDRQLTMAPFFDHVLVNDPTHLDRYREVVPADYVPHAYNPEVHRPGLELPDLDCVFVGTGYPSRAEWLREVDWTGIDLTLAGNWQHTGPELEQYLAHDVDECLPNEDTAALYRRARTSFNLYRTEANQPELSDGWAMGPREVELAATGCWFARQPRPEGDELLPMLPVVETPGELGDVLRWALAHPVERELAALAARKAVADRTFENNARSLLQRLDI